jgi:hypothetical protein
MSLRTGEVCFAGGDVVYGDGNSQYDSRARAELQNPPTKRRIAKSTGAFRFKLRTAGRAMSG